MHRDGLSVMFPLGSRGVGSSLAKPDPYAQMTAEMVLFMVIIFNFANANQSCCCFPLKLGSHFALVFPPAMTSLFGYLFIPVCSLFLFVFFCFWFWFFFSETYKKILYINIKLRLKQTDSSLKLKYSFYIYIYR